MDKRDDPNKAIKQIIDNAVVSEGVKDIFSLAGLDKPNIGILSEEFLEDVANIEYDTHHPQTLQVPTRQAVGSDQNGNAAGGGVE